MGMRVGTCFVLWICGGGCSRLLTERPVALTFRGGEDQLPVLNGTSVALVQRILSDSRATTPWQSSATEEEAGLLRTYFTGARRLWDEVAVYRKVRGLERSSLSWRERQIRRELPGHMARMMPLLVNPLPPPFGLVLIAVASAAPRYLLTRQFWTYEQCQRFASADGTKARRRYAAVLECCSGLLRTSETPLATPATPLYTLVDLFRHPPLSLESLRRKHLVRLAKSHQLYPVWLYPFLRTHRIRSALRKRAWKNDQDDDALNRDYTELDPRHLFHACAARGLKVDGDDAARASRLRAWLDARDAVLHSSSSSSSQLPPSFVLHMPAIFAGLVDHANI